MERGVRLACLLLAAALSGCGTGEVIDVRADGMAGDGDFGAHEDEAADLEVGAREQGLGSMETAKGYHLPFEAGKRHYIIQHPHGYRTNIWNAVDIHMARGENVHAMRGGVISAVVDTNSDYAVGYVCNWSACNNNTNFIIIQHDDGNESSYLHIAKGSVAALGLQPGSRVCRGQVIGKIGHNGYSYGPHVHISVQAGGSEGNRNQAWNKMWSKNTKIIHFEEAGGPVRQSYTYGSENALACQSVPEPEPEPEPEPAPEPAPSEPGCSSYTLGRTVASGECVQVAYRECGVSSCATLRCTSGAWQCIAPSACQVRHANARCGGN